MKVKVTPKIPVRLLAIGALAAPAILTASPNAHATVTSSPAHTIQLKECGDHGSSDNVTIYSYCDGNGYQVWAEFRHTDVVDGHLDVWGPNLPRRSSPNGYWPAGTDTQRWRAEGNGTACAEGWSRVAGKWRSVGLPCVTIS
ncbi:hypothetical protein [Actinomadura sp. 9N407]|uniref:hypothetical protein n=1 Tax=Actinomadura sp. 9N407 TaxID=3375154 RepID=UPI00379A756E